MTKAIIQSVTGANYFILNGINRPRSYEAIGVKLLANKKGVKIIPAQRDGTTIQETILFDEYEINGIVPLSQEECISLLNEIIFKQDGSGQSSSEKNKIYEIGEMQVFKKKTPSDESYEEGQQIGDYCVGFVFNDSDELEFISADYLGGNKTLKISYNI